jgi:hypothetical protein
MQGPRPDIHQKTNLIYSRVYMKRVQLNRKAPIWAKNKPSNQPENNSQIEVKAIKSVATFTRRGVISSVNDSAFAQPKENALQHDGYMRLVRLLPCARCGIEGYTQFCHADEGKGTSIKTDCRRGWPGCGPNNSHAGCHNLVGTSGTFPKEERRALDKQYGDRTRAKILDLGLWPANLPLWQETDQ